MNFLLTLTASVLLATACNAQFENGFVKILEDNRYQDGATFGNYRNQEDGIKYKEETDINGLRKGFWEYPDEHGDIKRVEFEAGPGIGFRIISSNIVAPTPIQKASTGPRPISRPAQRPIPQLPIPRPAAPRIPQLPLPVIRQPQPVIAPVIPLQAHPIQPHIPFPNEPINLFDYPADLQFFRDAQGHRFKFTAA